MTNIAILSLLENFEELEDPRRDRNQRHKLVDIVVLALCGVISGMKSWVDIADYGEAKASWFKELLELPNGIPSHDTFRRVFMLLEPECFQACLTNWLETLRESLEEGVVAIDGKTLRRSFDKSKEKKALHLVSAWSTTASMVLGQIAVEEKSNEIVAIPKLLELLRVEGGIFTIDAMGCQKEIAKNIAEKKGDYVLGLKENHPTFLKQVREFFNSPGNENYLSSFESVEGDHGRIETRSCYAASSNMIRESSGWSELKSIVMLKSKREIRGEVQEETRYYISSLEGDAEKLSRAIRSHWQIENSLHWVLDVNFDEDQCRIRDKVEAENFAILRRVAVGLLKNEKTEDKRSLRRKQNLAALNNNYLLKILRCSDSVQ